MKNQKLEKEGKYNVDVLKIAHHRSDRNASKGFFNTKHTNYYVISANGRDDNPSLATPKWIIKSGSKNPKKIIVTNKTLANKRILNEYDHKKFNCQCIILEKTDDFFTLNL
jgi:hypothetical protein